MSESRARAACGVVGEDADAGGGAVHAGGGAEAGADALRVFGELGGGARGGAFGQHAGGEGGEAGFAGRVGLAAGASDEIDGQNGQARVFDEQDFEAVLQREGAGDGQMEGGRRGRRRGRSCASFARPRSRRSRGR